MVGLTFDHEQGCGSPGVMLQDYPHTDEIT